MNKILILTIIGFSVNCSSMYKTQKAVKPEPESRIITGTMRLDIPLKDLAKGQIGSLDETKLCIAEKVSIAFGLIEGEAAVVNPKKGTIICIGMDMMQLDDNTLIFHTKIPHLGARTNAFAYTVRVPLLSSTANAAAMNIKINPKVADCEYLGNIAVKTGLVKGVFADWYQPVSFKIVDEMTAIQPTIEARVAGCSLQKNLGEEFETKVK